LCFNAFSVGLIGLGARILAVTRRDVFQEIGGFDESLPDVFADIDLCLKMRRAGYLIVYTPFAKLYKHEPRAEKIDMGNEGIMRERWPDVVQRDPYYMQIFLANAPISH